MNRLKYISYIMIAVIILSFTACHNNDNPTIDSSTTKKKTTTTEIVETVTDKNGDEVIVEPTAVATTSVAVKSSVKTTSKGTTISWSAVKDAVSYNVYRAAAGSSDYKSIANVTTTSYTDAENTKKDSYTYKITAIKKTTTTATTKSSSATTAASKKFVGSNVQFANQEDKNTLISSYNNNAYISFIKSEYTKAGSTCPDGILAYVAISGSDYVYVFQFDSQTKWNSSTLQQVQIFTNSSDKSKYFSFFTKDSGTDEYKAAKANAEASWKKTNSKISYSDMQKTFVTLADDTHFQQVIDASWS